MTKKQHCRPGLGRRHRFPPLGAMLAAGLLCLFPEAVLASGYRITNQSLAAVGIAGAHVASTPGPDSRYYNPANMGWLADQWQTETSLTFLGLPSVEYRDNRSPLLDGSSESELFLMPLVHAVSPRYGDLRFGFSLTYPFGLAKEWQQPFPRASAEQFSLFLVEANPTIAWALTDRVSLGGGVRLLYGKGEVESAVTNPPFGQLTPLTSLDRSADGTDTQWGYNLALTVRPADRLSLAATYRSENELDLEGTSHLRAWAGTLPLAAWDGDGSVALTLPAVFSLAAAYTVDRLTVELGWDRTFWSSFAELDFQYDQNLQGTVFDGFDRAMVKNWDDTDAYRIGLSYDWDGRWTTTLGFAYDQTPVPAATLGFEVPDADAHVYCAGLRYRTTETWEIGLSYMYHRTRSRSVVNDGAAGLPGLDGTFTEGGAHAITVGVIARF